MPCDWIGRQPSDTTPLLYLSGSLTSCHGDKWNEKEFHKATGSKYRCFSYAYVGDNHGLKIGDKAQYDGFRICQKLGVRMFLDSGAHSFHNILFKGTTLAKELTKDKRRELLNSLFNDKLIRRYAEFVQRTIADEGNKYDFYVTVDAVKDCPTIYAVTKRLEQLGINPAIVYHGDKPLDWLRKYIDEGHKLICIGVAPGRNGKIAMCRYYDSVFNIAEKHGVALHGFALTGSMMFTYPWYSVDSTTWIKAAGYGCIIQLDPTLKFRTAMVHASETYSATSTDMGSMSPSVIRAFEEHLHEKGFTLEDIRTKRNARALYNAAVMVDAVNIHTRKVKGKAWKSWEQVI